MPSCYNATLFYGIFGSVWIGSRICIRFVNDENHQIMKELLHSLEDSDRAGL
ncbi:hypothetical protein NC997_20770 [Trichocoleus sp. DQ-A2]|uniref:hypothetical protein n=1 Tax=Trichocoleus sp. DQ-A2 TaxID=2933924 RepID=UPI00168A36B5|nr:hypothetical protein [Coleofasciculus sp. FACHB-T130]